MFWNITQRIDYKQAKIEADQLWGYYSSQDRKEGSLAWVGVEIEVKAARSRKYFEGRLS